MYMNQQLLSQQNYNNIFDSRLNRFKSKYPESCINHHSKFIKEKHISKKFELRDKSEVILVVGPMRNGKSTFCNYMHNYGLKELFKTSDKSTSCTHIIESNDFLFVEEEDEKLIYHNIKIYDTPGIGEIEEGEELHHDLQFYEKLKSLTEIKLIVFCLKNDFEMNEFMKKSFDYYRKLYQPFIITMNYIFVLTKMNKETYDDLIDDKRLLDYIDEKKTTLESYFDIKIPFIQVMNNKLTKRKLKKIQNGLGVIKLKKDTLFEHTMRVKEMICTIACNNTSLNLLETKIPPSPKFEEYRKILLKVYNSEITKIIETVEITEKNSSQMLNRINLKDTKINEYNIIIEKNQYENDSLSKKQTTDKKIFFGDDIIRFKRITIITLNSPINEFEIKSDVRNCSYSIKERKDNYVKLKLSTDILNFRKKDGNRWYISIWLEYDGKIANIEKIKENNNTIKEHGNYRMLLMDQRNQDLEMKNENDVKYESYKKTMLDIRDKIEILSNETWFLNDIVEILGMIISETHKIN